MNWLKSQLKEKGISQAEIAQLLGVTQGKVSKMLNGALQIKSSDADRIRRHLGYLLPEDLQPGTLEYEIMTALAELDAHEKSALAMYLEALTGRHHDQDMRADMPAEMF